MIEIKCKGCGKAFKDYKSKKRVYCTHECYSKTLVGSDGYWLGKKITKEMAEKLRQSRVGKPGPRLGQKVSKETRLKISLANRGKKLTEEQRIKRSESQKGPKGSNWRGGITPINKLIRWSTQSKQWRVKIFERDNYACQDCGERGCYIQAHHIKEFSKYPELRFDLNNGVTLCKECHKKRHFSHDQKMVRVCNTEEMLEYSSHLY